MELNERERGRDGATEVGQRKGKKGWTGPREEKKGKEKESEPVWAQLLRTEVALAHA